MGLNRLPKRAGKAGASALPAFKDAPPTLSDIGIDKKLSSRSKKLAAVPVQEVNVLAERLMGEFLKNTPRNEGTRPEQRTRWYHEGTTVYSHSFRYVHRQEIVRYRSEIDRGDDAGIVDSDIAG